MGKKKREKVEFRYYELPCNTPLLARMGEEWKMVYGINAQDKHFHNLTEIGFCHYGEGCLVLGEEKQRFRGGMVSMIPPNYVHTTVSDEGVEAYWEYLFADAEKIIMDYMGQEPEKAGELITCIKRKAIFIREEDSPMLSELIRSILKELRQGREYYMESVKGLLFAAFIEIARMNGKTMEKSVCVYDGRTCISPALFYISEHYFEDMRIKSLAELCHMSETHFRRNFCKYMNMTPMEYISLIRVKIACELLDRTENTMEEIAGKCGFDTTSTLNRNFKKLLGTTPYQWKIHPENYEHKLLEYKITARRGW